MLRSFSEGACAGRPFRERGQSLRLGAFRGRGKKVTVSEIFWVILLRVLWIFASFSLRFAFGWIGESRGGVFRAEGPKNAPAGPPKIDVFWVWRGLEGFGGLF